VSLASSGPPDQAANGREFAREVVYDTFGGRSAARVTVIFSLLGLQPMCMLSGRSVFENIAQLSARRGDIEDPRRNRPEFDELGTRARRVSWQVICELPRPSSTPEASMRAQNYDESTIERWRLEPRFPSLELDETAPVEDAPPLWKDLAVASGVALAGWLAATMLFG
jgi:hypothetical protein